MTRGSILCIAILILSILLLVSCQSGETPVEINTVIKTVVETVVETVEVEKSSPYTYELLREMADMGNYTGDPASGHMIAFANIDSTLIYALMIQESIINEWISAGGDENSILVLDNMADSAKAMENAQQVFNSGAEAFIQFYMDEGINAVIGREASRNNIYMIAVEVPVQGYPIMGIDNYGAGVLAGGWAAGAIDNIYEGWENVDRVVYLDAADSSTNTALRIYGSKIRLMEQFEDDADDEKAGSRAVRIENVITSGDAQKATTDLLDLYPEDENIIVFCLNDSVAEGVYNAALEQERWDQDKWLLVSCGLDDRGKELVSGGVIDADTAFFPEKYGKYLIPAVLAQIYENPVPPYMFMENAIITADNIREYYP